MKKYIFSFLALSSFALSFGQNYYLATPQGYGANTTGGGNLTPVTVSTYADLKSNITAAGARVILVSGTITIPQNQAISAIVSNKSIIGLPGSKLINENQAAGSGILYFKTGSSNVILRNLTFVGPGAYDIDGQDNLTADGITNLWVDHCEFQDGLDGNFDIKGLSDNVSVSWTKFTYLKPPKAGGSGGSADHRFSNLIGSSASDAPADGRYSVTWQNCFWGEGVKGRMPRARNADVHILSSYYNTSVAGATGIGLGGGINNTTCYVENTNFAKVTIVYSPAGGDGGTVAINYVNSLRGSTNFGTVSPPSYSTTPIPVEDVAKFLTDTGCGAGATLQVSSTGVISPTNCSNLSTQNTTSLPAKFSVVTLDKDQLQLNFTKQPSGDAKIKIYSADGKVVLSKNEPVKMNSANVLNIHNLKTGIYIVSVSLPQGSSTAKFIKD